MRRECDVSNKVLAYYRSILEFLYIVLKFLFYLLLITG